MSGKFGSLLANVAVPFKVELVDPATDQIIRDKNGKASFIAVWSTDSAKSRDYDRSKRKDLFMDQLPVILNDSDLASIQSIPIKEVIGE